VDIRTGEIIKDRGVLSDLPKRYNFGDFADKDDDPAINTDLGDEATDNLAEDEEDNDEDGVEETDASPAPNGLVSSQITRLAPLRPATSSSDADDLRTFLKAEAIRRELDGGDDSSEDEFNILPPRSTPARRTTAPARRTPLKARAKPRPLQSPAPDTESEDEFAIRDSDRDDIQCEYRVCRTPSPEVPASIPSPPPPSSSPGPSSSFSLPSSPLLSHTPLSSNGDPRPELLGSSTPRRQPLSLASRKTLEDSLDEIDKEFPPPRPRAPSIFGRRPASAFFVDWSLSDADTEDERPCPPAKETTNPKLVASEPRPTKKTGSTLISRKPVPFVLIETKRPASRTPIPTVVASGSASASVDTDPVTPSQPHDTLPKKGRPRTRPLKDKPPDPGNSRSTVTAKPKLKTPRKPPEEFVDSDGRDSPPLPPSPSPAPPTRSRVRRALKRKRVVSSGSGSGEERGSPGADPTQRSSPPGGGSQACTTASEVADVDRDDPEAGALSCFVFFCRSLNRWISITIGGSKPRTRSQSCTKATTEVAPAPTNATPVVTSSSDPQREPDDTPNRMDGSYTHFPSPPPLPVGFPNQAHPPFAHYSGPPFQDPSVNFSRGPYLNHGHTQYGNGQYSFFQDSQALLAQAVTQLALIMNRGQPPPQIGQTGGMPGNMPVTNGFPGSPGWGMVPVWPPSTPTTSGYHYGHDHQQRSFQGPHVNHNQTGSGAGSSTPFPALFPSSNTFPSSVSLPGPTPIVQETGESQGSRTRSRSKSKWRVTFASDPRPGSGPGGSGETKGSPPTTRSSSRTKEAGKEAQGKSEVDKGSESDLGDSGEEGSAGVDPSLSSKSRRVVRGRTPGPGRR